MNTGEPRATGYQGGLQAFLHSGFYRAVAQLLVLALLITGIPVDYTRSAWAGSPTAPSTPVADVLTVGNPTLVATTRVSRTLFDFTYRATVTNSSSTPFSHVIARLTSLSSATLVIEGELTFGDVAAGAVVPSQDTYTIRQDRTQPFNPANLVWTFAVNNPPQADAGLNQTVVVGSLVQLNGSHSSDVDGDALTYRWAFSSRPADSAAALLNPTAVNPRFTVDKPGAYVVQLIVNDRQVDSAPATVTISTENSPPRAHAGLNQTVFVGSVVQLDGSQSSDVDGNLLSYRWAFSSLPTGSTAVLLNPTTVNPTFIVDKAGTYVVQLIVNDGQVDSTPATVTISTANSKPVANAGSPQTVLVGDTVQLDGSRSFDADQDPLTYQ